MRGKMSIIFSWITGPLIHLVLYHLQNRACICVWIRNDTNFCRTPQASSFLFFYSPHFPVEQEGIFIRTHLLWHRASVYVFSFKGQYSTTGSGSLSLLCVFTRFIRNRNLFNSYSSNCHIALSTWWKGYSLLWVVINLIFMSMHHWHTCTCSMCTFEPHNDWPGQT
jgi:hypothetical protein